MNSNGAILHVSTALGKLCCAKGFSIAVAESCTGGLLGAAITSVAGSSAYFRGGVTAYHNDVKHSLLGVPAYILKRHGAVSAPAVKAMAQGVRKLLNADYAAAISGVAGPGGGSRTKPVGLVYIGVASKNMARAFRTRISGDRKSVRAAAVTAALEYLRAFILDTPLAVSHCGRARHMVVRSAHWRPQTRKRTYLAISRKIRRG